ncbi:MAG: dihydrolipoyl dehydrogenase [Planctomycetota bacterium]
MADDIYDLVVIGSGPGGYVAAIRASQLKMKVCLVERESLGGVCLNTGCIPTKALLKSAELYQELKHAEDFGLSIKDAKVDFSKVIEGSRKVADKMSQGVQFLMKKNNVTVVKGTATLDSAGAVSVKASDGKVQTVKGKRLLVATGARARSLPNITVDNKKVITSTRALMQTERPGSLLVIGAGAIGVEFAYFYNAVGTEVTIVEFQDQLVPIEDADIGKELGRAFKKQGIDVHTASSAETVEVKGDKVKVVIKNKDGEKTEKTVDQVLVAVGVQGNVENLGLEKLGVKIEKSFIKVDAKFETACKGVFAIGDVIGPPLLAHVASAEAIRCVEWMAGHHAPALDYNRIPGCTYCHPQVASIGLTEKAAKEKGIAIKVGRFPLSANGKATAIRDNAGFVKKIFDAKYDQLIGVHIIGPDATEMLTASTVAITHEATAKSILHTVHAHPTLGEALMEASAAALGEAIHI